MDKETNTPNRRKVVIRNGDTGQLTVDFNSVSRQTNALYRIKHFLTEQGVKPGQALSEIKRFLECGLK